LQHAIAHRLDYNFETTLGGKTFSRLLAQAAEQGFGVRIWYVGLASPEMHLARIRARVRHGGHDIPELDVRRRFDQSRLQLIALLPHLAELRVYDNSDEAAPHAGQAPRPRLVLHWLRHAPATDSQPAQGQLRMPATPGDWAATPEWARPLVAAAGKLCGPAAALQSRPEPVQDTAPKPKPKSRPPQDSGRPRPAKPKPGTPTR